MLSTVLAASVTPNPKNLFHSGPKLYSNQGKRGWTWPEDPVFDGG